MWHTPLMWWMWSAALAETTCDGFDDDANGLVDDGACPADCEQGTFDGHGYLYCEAVPLPRGTPPALTDPCPAPYALVVVEDAAEDGHVAAAMGSTPYFIGLDDAGLEGSFVWTDGTSWSEPLSGDFRGFAVDSPDALSPDDDCVVGTSDGTSPTGWDDAACDVARPYVCEGCVTATFFRDTDGDGLGDPLSSTEACAAPDPTGWSTVGGDCDDTDDMIPGVDDDCSSGDADGDGIPDFFEAPGDTDGDGIADVDDPDDDGDGIPTATEGASDPDGDGVPNYLDIDSNGDGFDDQEFDLTDVDCDGTPDWLDSSLVDDYCPAPPDGGCAVGPAFRWTAGIALWSRR